MKIFSQYKGLKKEIYILFIGRLVTAMGSFVWPMMTYMLKSLDISDSLTTLILACSTLLSLPATYLGGRMADKFGRKRIIIIFDCITVGLYIVASFLPISYLTIIIILLASLAQSLEGPAYDSLTSDFSLSKDRDKAYSLLYLGFNLGFVVGATVSGLLYPKFVWLSFLLNGVVIGISTLLIILFIFEKNSILRKENDLQIVENEYEKPMEKNDSVIKVLKDRKILYFAIFLSCLVSIVSNTAYTILPLQLNAIYGQSLGSTYYGFMSSLNGFVVIVFTPIITLFMKKYTEIPKIILGMCFFVLGIIFYGFNIYALVYLSFIGMFISTLGEVSTVIGSNPYLLRRIPNTHRGRIMGIQNVICSLGVFVFQLLNSLILKITNDNYLIVWIIFGSIGIIDVILYLICYKYDKERFVNLYKKEREK